MIDERVLPKGHTLSVTFDEHGMAIYIEYRNSAMGKQLRAWVYDEQRSTWVDPLTNRRRGFPVRVVPGLRRIGVL